MISCLQPTLLKPCSLPTPPRNGSYQALHPLICQSCMNKTLLISSETFLKPGLLPTLSLSQPAPNGPWGSPCNLLTEEEKTQAWFVDGSARQTLSPQERGSCLLEYPEGQQRASELGSPPGGQSFKQRTCCLVLLGIGEGQTCDWEPIPGLQPMVWLGGQGLGRNTVRKWVIRPSG